MKFNWNALQYKEDGKILLLYRHERIFEEFNNFHGKVVCDIGSWGHLPDRFEQEGAPCYILDALTDEQYYPARVKDWPLFTEYSIETSPPKQFKKFFDFITCFEVMEHVENYLLGFINLHTMLKPDGWLIGTYPIPGGTHQLGDPTVKQWLTPTDITNILVGMGMKNIIVEPTASVNKDDAPVSYYFKAQK